MGRGNEDTQVMLDDYDYSELSKDILEKRLALSDEW